jgi:cysteinyl-tRNA synthetase
VEPVIPLEAGKIRLYTCGPTVYNHVHLGNLRTFLFEDLLKRTLRFFGYEVVHVMNLTDVDDKTIAGAAEKGVPLAEYTAPFIDSFFADIQALRVEPADHYPRATAFIPQMIALIERLLERGHAYVADGSVWFRIASDPGYGRLRKVDPQSLRVGERVAQDEYDTEDVRDFVLWKGAKPGEPSWPSPWGPGRPGWHIECSAMSMTLLGPTIDIHCGGVDNLFPHHENEIAQSEGATGQTFVRHWVHAEHLIVDGQKMSKSLGNFYTLKDLLAKDLSPRAIRYLLLSVHYRQKLNFTFAGLAAAESALDRLDQLRLRLEGDAGFAGGEPRLASEVATFRRRFREALSDDLNVSEALAAVFDLVREANRAIDTGPLGIGDRELLETAFDEFDRVFGVLQPDPPRVGSEEEREMVERLIAERAEARRKRDFLRADAIREELFSRGIVLEDTPSGTRWKRVRRE